MNFKIPEGKKYTGPERVMVFFYFGNDPDRFLKNFSQYGFGIKLREDMADEIRHPSGVEELMNRPMTDDEKELVAVSKKLMEDQNVGDMKQVKKDLAESKRLTKEMDKR